MKLATIAALAKALGGGSSGGGGGGGGVLVVTATYDAELDAEVLDKTAGEIWSAYTQGLVIIHRPDGDFGGYYLCAIATLDNGGYTFSTNSENYIAENSTDYPVSGGR